MAKLVLTLGRSYGKNGTKSYTVIGISPHGIYYAVLSSCISCKLLHLASQSSAAQGRLESPKIKSGLYTKFQDVDDGFLQTLESM